MSGMQYPVDIKDFGKFEYQNNNSVNVCGYENKKIFLLRITTMTPTSQHVNLKLAKYLIMYWWKTWADWYQSNIIITTANTISANIVYMAVPVKKYWKNIWKDASYMEHKESSFQKLTTRRGLTKSSFQKQNTNCAYFLSSTQISKVFYINKARVNPRHQNPSSPNTSNTYHVEAASTLHAVMDDTLMHPKSI